MDASAFFNVLSGYSDPPVWNKLVVAPLNLRERIVAEINQEINWTKKGEKGYIIAKMNSLLDKKVIAKLYEASVAGVKIDLIIRGICVLRPGLEKISDNITVRSIVGRFLEHSRIFYFRNGGHEDVFISSADWMPRNLNDRVELMVPIEYEPHKKRLKGLLELYLRDNQKAYAMRSDGSYQRVPFKSRDIPINVQKDLQEQAEQAAATHLSFFLK
jgi:polyphosphate kinase